MSQDINFFAETNFRHGKVKFGIKTDDRRRHMYVIGKTGMGKSTLLENMIIQDIQAGHGVCVIDPHGDLVEKIVDFIPNSRVNDVVYFNPADLDFPIAFNVLENVHESERHLVVSGLIGVFKKIWADSWGPRLEYVLHHAISALLEYPGSTLLGIMRILVDKSFRNRVIEKVTDPVVKSFWVDEYSKYPDRFQSEAIAPIQNKVGRFLSSALVRNILGQVKSSFNMRQIMDEQKILLLNLAKGRVGEDNSALLGAMMITKIQLAAMSRVNIPENERKDFYLYVDEFQNFATESFAGILSEARKYRLDLTIAHQYIEQVEENVQAAVFGNVGTLVAFRVGATDAEFLEKEFFPTFTQTDLVNLTKFEIYLKLMIDGVSSEAFSAATMAPIDKAYSDPEIKDKVIKVSRERYAKPRELIEEKIIRWSENKEDTTEAPSSKDKPNSSNTIHLPTSKRAPETKSDSLSKNPREKSREKPKKSIRNKVICSFCGKNTEINFDPDPSKPIYCKECLDLSKQGKIPSPNNIKIVEDKIPVEEEKDNDGFISLAEALKIKPNLMSENVEVEKDMAIRQAKSDEAIQQAQSEETPQQTQADTDQDKKIIQPGEIIKF
ncbi:type IV secretion system DNA-binding domain-containing protein [Patescibacteria group bacterium]|nr:type IV secretion system DNA-binding domain-containing protein [Patescibacteria group bacterium]